MVADAIDLRRRKLRDLTRHHDRGAQTRLLVEPLLDLPVVDGAGQGDSRIGVVQTLDLVGAVQNARLHIEGIKYLGTEVLETRSRCFPVRPDAAGADAGGRPTRIGAVDGT